MRAKIGAVAASQAAYIIPPGGPRVGAETWFCAPASHQSRPGASHRSSARILQRHRGADWSLYRESNRAGSSPVNPGHRSHRARVDQPAAGEFIRDQRGGRHRQGRCCGPGGSRQAVALRRPPTGAPGWKFAPATTGAAGGAGRVDSLGVCRIQAASNHMLENRSRLVRQERDIRGNSA